MKYRATALFESVQRSIQLQGQRIADITKDDPIIQSAVANCLRAWKSKRYVVVEQLREAIFLCKCGDNKNGCYFCIDTISETILHFVKYYSRAYLNLFPNAARGTFIFRLSNDMALAGISYTIFFKYLLEEFPVVTSDAQETLAGERVWQVFVKTAFENGNYNVYVLDCNSKKVTRANSFQDPILRTAWGDTPNFQGIRVALEKT